MRHNNIRNNYNPIWQEIVEIKSDYKSWIRSLKVIAIAATLILSILAYFGYDKIDTLEKTVLERTNERLEKTDSLLSKIDDKRIEEINKKIHEKEKEYKQILNSFDEIIIQNRQMQDKILSILPPNKRIEAHVDSYYESDNNDYFEIQPISKSFKQNSKVHLYLIFNENFNLKNAEFICFQLMQGNTANKIYYYQIEQRFNNIYFTLDVAKGNYLIQLGYYSKSNNKQTFYNIKKNITVN